MPEPTTIGSYLRAARRKRGLSIESAAESTRIRSQYLMRMESDEFDFLAPTYVRGFLRSYARYLEVAEQPLIEEFDRRYGGTRAEPVQIMAVDRPRRRSRRPRPRLGPLWTRGAVAAALLVAGLAFIGLLSGGSGGGDGAPAGSPRAESTPRPSPTASSGRTEAPRRSPDGGAVAVNDRIAVKVTALERCWLEIYGDGEQLYYETLEPGATERFTAKERMFIVFGYPPGVEVTVNGRAVELPPGQGRLEITLPDQLGELI